MRELGPGDEFAGCVIEGLAARGGMGLVYRARQRSADRTVAVKVIAPELAADPDFRARFEQESKSAARIEHPNVIPVYDVGEDDGLLFITMRFVHGEDLRELAGDAGPLEMARVVRIVGQVAEALDAAHAQGLVHRDVKPGNILVTDHDHVYLTDFGLSKRIGEAGRTRTGSFVGTVDYIAPEQAKGLQLDARADVYSLGCVTYQLLAGQVPFPRDSDVAKLLAHVSDPPPRLTSVPAALADAVQRAMAKDPAERFPSAGDFGRALAAGAQGQAKRDADRAVAVGGAALRDAPTQLGEVPASVGGGGPRRPRRRLVLFGVLAALLLAGLGAGLAVALSSGGSTPGPLVPSNLTPSTGTTT